MKKLAILALTVVLAACNADVPADSSSGTVQDERSSDDGNPATPPDAVQIPVEPDGGNGSGAVPPADATMEKSIPLAVRGKWREIIAPVAGASGRDVQNVTAAQCVNSDSKNMGKILNIRADGFSFFEQGGRLLTVQERSASRIRATYDTTYADTPTRGDYVFDVQDGGKTLVMREYGDNARPGPIFYKKCPR